MSKKKQEKESMDTPELYREIVVSTNTLIWRTDTEGRFTFLNPTWEKYGYKAGEMLGKPFSSFQMPEAAEHYVASFRNCLIGEPIVGHETTYFSKGGDEVYLTLSMTPLYDNEVITGTQGTAFDITERKHADDLLQYISAKDELTGLYNLHTFMSMTEHQIKTAEREKTELLIIYAGVDGMQSINDEIGSEAGDQVLIAIANIFRKTFREADVLARTGGDEFVISTLVSSRDTEEMILTRLNGNIDEYNDNHSEPIKLSMSFGTSFYNPEHSVSIEEVLSRADDTMHETKKRKKA